MIKTCKDCSRRKPVRDFRRHPGHRDGRRSVCKSCLSEREKKRYRTNRDLFTARALRKYGLTLEEHRALRDAQGGVCAICGNPETNTYRGVLRRLSVDHSHVTGQVRGLLCNGCNRGIGLLGDNPEGLRRAADYLEGFIR